MQRDFIESIAIKRTNEIQVKETVFNYTKINKQLYYGFRKEKEFFIALPEKAFLDALYLMSFGRYSFDLTAIDTGKLDRDILTREIKKYPQITQNMAADHGSI